MHKLLGAVTVSRVRFAIIDLTGVVTIDARAADHLLRIVGAVGLVGAKAIVTGIQPAVSMTMASLDVNMGSLVTHRTLREALRASMRALARR